ncbi:RNA polymerase C-22 sterol desaturase [Tulasnella sp. 419]|nr:RNA polymerase C-22 sterol desaturase [Tulasnella sp. 419]
MNNSSTPGYSRMSLKTGWSAVTFEIISQHKLLVTSAVIVVSLLILEQTVYRAKKKWLPGDKWTIPLIGKFKDSLNPTLENYMKQWSAGPLSALSVFNLFIVMASSNEYTRKILNSPSYTEPCLVASAKAVLEAENWVFLNGKAHADYRRGLNALFTRKAISCVVSMISSNNTRLVSHT